MSELEKYCFIWLVISVLTLLVIVGRLRDRVKKLESKSEPATKADVKKTLAALDDMRDTVTRKIGEIQR